MGRVTVWVPDELLTTTRAELPEVNYSAALQAGLRALLACDHPRLACTACGDDLTQSEVLRPAQDHFFRDLMFELRLLVDAFGTVEGAARVVRKVAIAHGITTAVDAPLPRATKTARARRSAAAVVEMPREADARRRHPTGAPLAVGE